MARITWDDSATREYETGVDHGVLYVMDDNGAYPEGVGWNGLTSINESPEGAEPTALYADNMKYLELMSAEEWKGTIEAYMSPVEFDVCDGSVSPVKGVAFGQQARKKFGLVYRTRKGNDVQGDAYGYKIHIVYGLLASPSEKNHETVNDSPSAVTLSWSISSTPVAVEGYRPLSTITIDSTALTQTKLQALEDVLFGTDGDSGKTARLPLPAEILTLVS